MQNAYAIIKVKVGVRDMSLIRFLAKPNSNACWQTLSLMNEKILAVRFPQRANGGNKKGEKENEENLSSTYALCN